MKTTVIFLIVLTSYGSVQAQTSCEELVEYRDVTLFNMWDDLHNQLTFNQRDLQDYQLWKATLQSDYTGVNVGTLLSALKGVSNLITNTFQLVTPTGKMIDISKNVSAEALDQIKAVRAMNDKIGTVKAVYEDGAVGLLKNKVVNKLGMLGSLYEKINTLVEDVTEFNDFQQSRQEILQMLVKYDELIEKHQALVEQSRNDMTKFNEYLNYITGYLNEHCGN
jgi:hypothetical protein